MLGRLRPAPLLTALVVGGACGFVFWQLRPDLLFADTTATGGDLGAHVWGPAYLRDHLLPHGRLSGWAPDWFAGFPWLVFYFPLPSLLVVLIDVALPYTVAFKLVVVSGVVALPLAAWAFGRLSGMRAPGPACLAVATLPFLFDRTFPISGGNIPSTIAGEFSFAIGLSVALVFLGVYARSLASGRYRAWAAALLALVALCHVVTAFFAVVGAVVLTGMQFDRHRLRFAAPVAVVAALLAAFWMLPFLLRLPYTNDVGVEKIREYVDTLFHEDLRWLLVLAAVGAVVSVVRRQRTGLFLSGMAVAAAVAFVAMPQSRLSNIRILPFWLLCLHLLAGLAVAELGVFVGRTWRRPSAREGSTSTDAPVAMAATPVVALVAALVFVTLPLQRLPSWFPLQTDDESYVPHWARMAFGGYERADAYPEYRGLVGTMRALGRTEGCGRAMWEYSEELGRFGTSYGLMLLPHWTRGCIASMKGLFLESAASMPYEHVAESYLSAAPALFVRGVPYRSLDVARGVPRLRLLGVRYYLAFSEEAKQQARLEPSLRLVATSGPWSDTSDPEQAQTITWEVYVVEGSDIVAPLDHEPVVVEGVAKAGKEWRAAAFAWYERDDRWDVPLAASGLHQWRRVRGTDADPPRTPVTPAVVSDIRADDDSISFDVDRVGSPVLVKASYFPNWRVSGAQGVWRVTPDHMVVIPTSRHVTLRYGTTPVDVAARLLTLLGVAGLLVLWRRGRVDFPGTEGGPARSGSSDERGRGRDVPCRPAAMRQGPFGS